MDCNLFDLRIIQLMQDSVGVLGVPTLSGVTSSQVAWLELS